MRDPNFETSGDPTMIEKILLGIGAAIALYIMNSALFLLLLAGALLYGLMRFAKFVSGDD